MPSQPDIEMDESYAPVCVLCKFECVEEADRHHVGNLCYHRNECFGGQIWFERLAVRLGHQAALNIFYCFIIFCFICVLFFDFLKQILNRFENYHVKIVSTNWLSRLFVLIHIFQIVVFWMSLGFLCCEGFGLDIRVFRMRCSLGRFSSLS